jgi:hypothetical protein
VQRSLSMCTTIRTAFRFIIEHLKESIRFVQFYRKHPYFLLMLLVASKN